MSAIIPNPIDDAEDRLHALTEAVPGVTNVRLNRKHRRQLARIKQHVGRKLEAELHHRPPPEVTGLRRFCDVVAPTAEALGIPRQEFERRVRSAARRLREGLGRRLDARDWRRLYVEARRAFHAYAAAEQLRPVEQEIRRLEAEARAAGKFLPNAPDAGDDAGRKRPHAE